MTSKIFEILFSGINNCCEGSCRKTEPEKDRPLESKRKIGEAMSVDADRVVDGVDRAECALDPADITLRDFAAFFDKISHPME